MAFKPTLLPVAAAIMTLGLQAQSAAQTDKDQKLSTVKVEAAEETSSNSVRATETTIGKGRQALRDIPQSVTVLTERLIDDRNLDTVKEALRNTAGVTFLAAEGGEEDVRLRGFSLQATGDLFVDGMRDPAIYDRDTFNLDRLEVLRGSASMLFGRGSTGGAVNQVNKQPQLWDSNQLDITLGEHNYRRVVADLNKRVGERSGLRVTAMNTQADNNGSGSALDKHGIAATLGLGIGEQNEFEVSAYRLQNNNGVNYGMPFIPPVLGSTDRELLPVDPASYFGLASDYNDSSADIFTVGHTYRFSVNSELKTRIRQGHFERDLRSGAIRLNTTQPHGVGASLETLSDATILTRGTHIKVQEMDNLHVQSDFSNKFKLHNMEHQLLAGADFSREEKTVFAARNAAQGGVNITKPTTTVGTPNDGAFVDEASRVLRVNNTYVSTGFGAYIQDLVQVAPHWKLLGGLRYDSLKGDYQTYTLSATNPSGPVIPSDFYDMDVSEFSYRAGALYQPSARESYHASVGTSFNTSGDAYSLGASNADTPPEKSMNLELGGRLDAENGQSTARFALFHSTKYNERNTDPLLPVVTLSGQRHVAGLELDLAGRLSPKWEVFSSYTWMPIAKVDKAAPCPATGGCAQGAIGERPGDRPALTPHYSAAAWTTYQVDPQLRVGAGLNARGKQRPTRVAFHVPAYVTLDLMAEYAVILDRFILKANLNNVTDKLYAEQLYPAHYVPGAGRNLQVTATVKF